MNRERYVLKAIEILKSKLLRDYVYNNICKIIADDFLRQNLVIDDYLVSRNIFVGYLYVGLLQLTSNTKNIDEKMNDILSYCHSNEIKFDKLNNLRNILSINIKEPNWNYKLYNIPEEYNYNDIAWELNRYLILAHSNNVSFGISEYYSYFKVPINILMQNYDMTKYPQIKLFYNQLIDNSELQKIDLQLAKSAKKISIGTLNISYVYLKAIVDQLSSAKLPIIGGTVQYVNREVNKQPDSLKDINKIYIKNKFKLAINE